MIINNMYIISYFPDAEKIRNKRKNFISRTVEYWNKHDIIINIIAQNYEKSDFLDGVNYIESEPILPGSARNIALDILYQSDEDYTVIVDDDITLFSGDKYIDSDNVIDILRDVDIEKMKNVDVFNALNPSQTPFTEYYNKNKSLLDNNLIFSFKPHLSGGDVFIKNIKKHKNKTIFYDDRKKQDGTLSMGEDVLFGLKCARNGFGTYYCRNFIRRDIGWNSSTYCTKEERKKHFKELDKTLEDSGLVNRKNGRFQWSKIAEEENHQKQIIVPKKDSISISAFME